MSNPETKFTDKVRKKWKLAYPEIQIYKHSDRFNGGIADLHFVTPCGRVAWVEVKWEPYVAKRRKSAATDLQVEFLREHAEKGVPSFVLTGTNHGCVWTRIEDFDGYVYRKEMKHLDYVHELIAEVIHG